MTTNKPKPADKSRLKETELTDNLILPTKPSFTVIQGDKPPLPNPKPPVGSDWLSLLPIGTVFLSRNRGSPSGILNQWMVCVKADNAVKLFCELNQEVFIWVDPIEFCSYNSRHAILDLGNGTIPD